MLKISFLVCRPYREFENVYNPTILLKEAVDLGYNSFQDTREKAEQSIEKYGTIGYKYIIMELIEISDKRIREGK